MPSDTPTRVLLVDDQHVTRHGVAAVLEAAGSFRVVGHAVSAEQALAAVLETRPDVVVAEVRLADGDGVELIRAAVGHRPDTRFVVLTSTRSAEAYHQAVLAGAHGYVGKDAPCEVVVETVRRVAGGERMLLGGGAPVPPADPVDLLLVDLTDRECAILRLLAAGRTNREIAGELFLAEKTVRNYVSSVLSKLGMRNRTEVAAHVGRLAARQEAQRHLAS